MHPRCISDRSQRDPRSIPHPSHVHPTSLPDPSSPKGACLPSRQVGYWYVESLDDGWCRVYYSTDSVLPTWIPGAGHSVAYVHQPMCISLCASAYVHASLCACAHPVLIPSRFRVHLWRVQLWRWVVWGACHGLANLNLPEADSR